MLYGNAYPVWVLLVVIGDAGIPFKRCQLSRLVKVKCLQSNNHNHRCPQAFHRLCATCVIRMTVSANNQRSSIPR